ncbi:MAG: lamin tail domain-containing protein, partial [Verrucomicrobiota bacterium]
NQSDQTIDLEGYSLSDEQGVPGKFAFPTGSSIEPGDHLVVLAGALTSDPYLSAFFALNGEGESVFLFDPSALLVDSVTFGIQIPGTSIGRVGLDQEWQLNYPSPGQPNERQAICPPTWLRINELLAGGTHAAIDDFVELYNPAPLPVSLAGLVLTDDPDVPSQSHTVTPLSFIKPGGFTVFSAEGVTGKSATRLGFRLSSLNDWIVLKEAEGAIVDSMIIHNHPADQSVGRLPDGGSGIEVFDVPTFGLTNEEGGDPVAYQKAEHLVSFLRITEIMYNPLGGTTLEFLELQNLSPEETLDLTGVGFSDGIDFAFPPGTEMPPGSFLYVVADQAAFIAHYGTGFSIAGEYSPLGLGSKLSNGGERIALQLPAPFDTNILTFEYNDTWYRSTDGTGFSLEIRDPFQERSLWDRSIGWQSSSSVGGSPEGNNAPGFAQWSAGFGLTGVDVNDDGDGDGWPLLAEYAMGSNPLTAEKPFLCWNDLWNAEFELAVPPRPDIMVEIVKGDGPADEGEVLAYRQGADGWAGAAVITAGASADGKVSFEAALGSVPFRDREFVRLRFSLLNNP